MCSLGDTCDSIIRQSGGPVPFLSGFPKLRNAEPRRPIGIRPRKAYFAAFSSPRYCGNLRPWCESCIWKRGGFTTRARCLPYNATSSDQTELIFTKLWPRARRILVCSAVGISSETPIEAKPTTTTEKKNPNRTASTDRRVIADMRRAIAGCPVSQYYPVLVPSVESISLLWCP